MVPVGRRCCSLSAMDVYAYQSVLEEAEAAGRWEETLSLLDRMAQDGLPVRVRAVDCAVAACGKAGQCERALEVAMRALDAPDRDPDRGPDHGHDMPGTVPALPATTLSAALGACEQAGRWAEGAALLRRNARAGPGRGAALLIGELDPCIRKRASRFWSETNKVCAGRGWATGRSVLCRVLGGPWVLAHAVYTLPRTLGGVMAVTACRPALTSGRSACARSASLPACTASSPPPSRPPWTAKPRRTSRPT